MKITRPESLGLSSERLKRLDAHFDAKYVQTGKLPFVMTLVARKGEVAHHGFSGLMDEARGKKVEADSLFRIYSMTKPLTSALFMMLVEEGKVALDQPVDSLIPSWKNLRRLRRRVGRDPHHALRPADADGGPAPPHLRPHLRLPAAHQRRRRLS